MKLINELVSMSPLGPLFPQSRRRTIRAIAKYSTPRKLANLAQVIRDKLNRTITPKGVPYRADIAVTNRCNLQCPACPTGKQHYGRQNAMISLDHITNFLDELGDYLYVVNLFQFGEPLLHPRIGDIISMVHSRKIFTMISSHLSLTKKSQLEAACNNHLDHLMMSIDGASEDVYLQYRKNGDFPLVLENVAYLVDYKRRNNLKSPTLEWRFLRFDHNLHEVDAARKMAEEMGVDIFSVEDAVVTADISEAASDPEHPMKLHKPVCKSLYGAIQLHGDGGIAPCCSLIDKEDDFGDLGRRGDLRKIWHNERYVQARQLFDPGLLDKLPPNLDHPCLHCPLVHAQPHLGGYLKNNPTVDFDGVLRMEDGEMAVRRPAEVRVDISKIRRQGQATTGAAST